MDKELRSWTVGVNHLILAALVVATIPIEISRAQMNSPVIPECKPADLDVSINFMNETPVDQTVALNFRNLSEHSCMLSGGIGVMFNDDRHGHNIWAKECLNCSSGGKQKFVAPLTLGIGETGHLVLRWKSAFVGSNSPCQEASGFNTESYQVVTPSLISNVCSVVSADSYLPGLFTDESQALDNTSRVESSALVKLESSDSILYAGDSFSFRVTVDDPSGQLPINDASCPIVFIRTRSADGAGAFEEIGPYAKCAIAPSTNGRGRLITMIIRDPGLGVLNQLGPSNIQIDVLAGAPHAHKVAIIASNKLDLNILDPAAMPRTWGPEVKGVAVSLGLDSETYAIGADIPLRIAIENFSAGKNIEGVSCGAGITIEVRDRTGKLVPSTGEKMMCMLYGRRISYPKGTVVPILQMTLREFGILPDQPGTYTVTATWNAFAAAGQGSVRSSSPIEAYASAHSRPITFRIVGTR
jgi:hypothetical protein